MPAPSRAYRPLGLLEVLMLQLRPEHFEALRPVVRKQTPERLLASALRDGQQAYRDPGTGDLVVTDQRGFSSRLAFYPDGLPKTATLPTGRTQHFEHDEKGRLAATTYPGGERLELQRDQRGNITRLERPGLLAYRFEYDEENRPTRIEHPDGTSERFTYHASGELSSATDRAGAQTVYERSENGTLQAVVDPLGRRTRYVTDAEGKLDSVVFPDGTRQSYGFDPDSNVAGATSRDDKVVIHELDDNGAVKSITWADGTRQEFELAGDRLLSATNAQGKIECSYDGAGNLLSETTEAGKVEFRYDPEGQMTEIVTPWGDSIVYEYDGEGRPVAVRAWDGRETRITYHEHGGVAEIRYGNGLVERQEHSRTSRQAHAVVQNPQRRTLSEQRYTYDLDGRLTALLDVQGASPKDQHGRVFEYDAAGRLAREKEVGGRRVLAEYQYDAKGNMVSDRGRPIEIGLLDEPIRVAGRPIEYDGAGRMRRLPGKRGELNCLWGDDGTLREVEIGGRRTQFAYDALGRRVLKTTGTETWRYIWADRFLLAEEYRATPDAEPVRRDYLYYPNTVIPLAFRENGQTHWLQTDVRGAVLRAFDDQGQTSWSGTYDSFGEVSVTINRVRQPFRLAGQYEDEETGLYYNFARYYAPSISSYVSRDPSWYHPAATNYSYAKNDPWNHIDPWGALAFLAVLGAIAAGAVVGAVVGAVDAWISGEDIGRGALLGAVEGAGWSAGIALGGTLGMIPGAFIGGAAKELVRQLYDGEPIRFDCALIAGGRSALWAIGVALLVGGIGLLGAAVAGTALGARALASSAAIRSMIAKSRVGQWMSRIFRPRRIPYGFGNRAEFEAFSANLNKGLRQAGLDDVQAVFQGSSVTGRKYTTGAPFDVGRISDFDIALASRELMVRARAVGVPLRSAGTRTGPLTERQLEVLGLRRLSEDLAQQAGRPVNFMIFDSIEAATTKAPSILVPR